MMPATNGLRLGPRWRYVARASATARSGRTIGVISIAGPRMRLTPERMQSLAPAVLAAAAELGPISRASNMFGRPALGRA